MAVSARGGVWKCLWGLAGRCGVLQRFYGRVLKSEAGGAKVRVLFTELVLTHCLPMSDPNDLMPAQEKLEWVTPNISLMETGETHGSKPSFTRERNNPLTQTMGTEGPS